MVTPNKHCWIISLSTFFFIVLTNLTAIFTFNYVPIGVGLLVVSVLDLAFFVYMVKGMESQKRMWHHALFIAVLSAATILVTVGVASRNKSYVLYPFIVSLDIGRK
jgi:hypothetical protein